MDSGFSSPRTETFPAGLRVLVVDDDPTWLKILEKMLKKCLYEVTICGLARDALNLLRGRKDGYDIVISDVNMPDMDGFKLLEHVGLEMDLPVIMMSVDGETSRVMKGVQHGACDYLLKPIRMKELRNIWQHVFRKRIHEVRDIESQEVFEGIQMTRNGSDQYDDGQITIGEDPTSVKKRKDVENRHDDKDFGDQSSMKKARVVWSVDLHQKFVKAVNQIGLDKVGPKRILDLMNVPWLTRENVASHLQKYRLYLSRLPKENDLKSSYGVIKHSDLPSKDAIGSSLPQNSINMQQDDVTNGNYIFSGNILAQNVDAKSCEGDLKGIVSVSKAEPKRTPSVEIPDSQKARISKTGINHSFASQDSEVNHPVFDSAITQYSWREVPKIQFKQEHKPVQLENGFSHLPQLRCSQQHIQVDQLQPAPSISSGFSMTKRDIVGPIEFKPLCPDYRSSHVSQANPKEGAIESFPVQSKSHMVNHQALDPISTVTADMKKQGINLSCITDLESAQRSPNSESGSTFPSMDKDVQRCWLQGDSYAMNLGLQNIEFLEYNDPGLFTEVPIHLYDALRFDYGYPSDPTEYSIIDQGLFIV